MSAPLVSIVVPVFNAARVIAQTIESALAQDWPDKEIIVVDDGSSDGSAEAIRRFEPAGVRLIQRSNAGGSAARNTGFAASRGRYIQFLDHDDLLAADKLSLQLRVAADESAPIAGVWTRFRGQPGGAYGGWCPADTFRRNTPALDWLIASPMVPTCAWLTPRWLVEAVGGWNEALTANPDDDGEFFMRVIDRAGSVRFSEGARSYFRTEGDGSAGHNRSEDSLRSVFEVCRTFERIVTARTGSEVGRRACADRYLAFMYMAYPQCRELIAEAEQRVAALGFEPSRVPNTPLYERLSAITGWRAAKRLQQSWQFARRTFTGRGISRH